MAKTLQSAVAAYGVSVKAKFSGAAISGAPEDQLRNPLETLIGELAELAGFAPGTVHLVGETTLAHLQSRPDFAVSVNNALMGFIEVKAPGKGCDPRKFTDAHDKGQWAKLKSLPNVIYTDGTGFTLWRDGELAAKPVLFEGDLEKAGAKLTAPPALVTLLTDFLRWTPQAPKNAKALANVAARLCRLLRGEVMEQMELGNESLLHLKDDWRKLLFPDADNERFADGYAQAVTFGLLMARAFNIPLNGGVEEAALKLKKVNSLIGTALNLLTENAENQEALRTSLDTLLRVLHEVNWAVISKDKPEAWLYFYEDFLEVYDPILRKQSGSYYTPPEVVSAMVRLVDEALRGPLFERAGGLASPDVTIADPAVGTGTFLLGVLRKIASNVEESEGEGTVAGAITSAAKRLYGFEMQFGPFAVAQLRLLAEMQALLKPNSAKALPEVNLFITNTLGNPFEEEERLPHILEEVAKSRRNANKVKRGQPITVVIGNPPYKEKSEGLGGWIEKGSGGRLQAPLERWQAPVDWGVGPHAKHLKNLYVYFWRWATLKVFGSGWNAATDLPERDDEGLVCFITMTGFINGPAFEKMRDDLRRTCSRIWVIGCNPEGHRPPSNTHIFPTVMNPVCIVVAAKQRGKDHSLPALVKFKYLRTGVRKRKFEELGTISLYDDGWADCPDDWRAPFLPKLKGDWALFVPLSSLFVYNGSGVMPGRTWVIAPDKASLTHRWKALTSEPDDKKKQEIFQPHLRKGKPGDKHVHKEISISLHNHEKRLGMVSRDKADLISPCRYAFRSFDRQWIIPDARLINQPNPNLWEWYSDVQVHITAPQRVAPSNGPAISFTDAIPDIDHYHGRGGRVYPLWFDSKTKQSNIRAEVFALLVQAYGHAVSPEDVMAYIAAVMAHPAFTARFQADLVRPGLRLPLTADTALFAEAVKLGREVIWLHSYGERFTDGSAGRPKGAPRMAKDIEPTITAKGQIPPTPEPLPDTIHHDPATNRLHVGQGYVENVTTAIWQYEVSGKQVVRQWFSYRKLDRTRRRTGDRPPSPLEKIQPDGWLSEYTTDLLNLLRVLGRLIALEPAQADLLARICEGPLVPVDELRKAGLIGEDENEESRVDASEPETV